MVSKRQIQRSLLWLDKAYNRSKLQMEALYLSKLAILELCGWTEESMDDIIQCFANPRVTEPANQAFVEKQVIGRTYSFEYERFRNMLIQVMGIINVERLEGSLDTRKSEVMKATLSALKECRDKQAHTHVNVTMIIDAPSVTQRHLQMVYEGLKDIESCVRKLNI